MAIIDLLSGFTWGVDKLSIEEGNGAVRPRIVTAAAITPSTVRVLFDREMDFHPTYSTTLEIQNYRIVDADGYELVVLRATQADVDAVDLLTELQADEVYYLEGSTEILDAYGAPLDPAYNEAQFDGIPPAYPSFSDGYFFMGLDTGMQVEEGPLPNPDYDPPVLQNQDPIPGQIEVPTSSDINFDIVDSGSGVNADSVVLRVRGTIVWTSRAAQPGYSVSETPIVDGYRYSINPDSNLPGYQWITVGVYAEDINPSGPPTPNVLDTTYQFKTQDIEAPFLINLHPEEDTGDNPRDGYISLDIVDIEGRVDGATILVDVGGFTAFDGATETFLSPFDDPGSSFTPGTYYDGYDGYDGYRIILQRTSDFPSYELVSVRARAQDLSANVLDRTYSFRIEDYVGPVLQNQNPSPGQGEVPVDASIELEVVDLESGVNGDSVVLSVDGYTAWTGRAAQPGFAVLETLIADGYRYVITPDVDLASFEWVVIGVYAEDYVGPNILDTSYQFRTKDINAPYLINLDPDEGTTQNPRDGYIAMDMVDPEGTISLASILIDVNGSTVFDGLTETFHTPFNDPGSSITPGAYGPDGYDGYRIILERTSDFPSYQLVTVDAYAKDVSSNILDRTYSFRIEDFEGPIFANPSPDAYGEDIDQNTLITIVVYDRGSGLDLSTLTVDVNGRDAYDGGFHPPFDGYYSAVDPYPIDGYDGYLITVDATNAYPSGQRVFVDVNVDDREGN